MITIEINNLGKIINKENIIASVNKTNQPRDLYNLLEDLKQYDKTDLPTTLNLEGIIKKRLKAIKSYDDDNLAVITADHTTMLSTTEIELALIKKEQEEAYKNKLMTEINKNKSKRKTIKNKYIEIPNFDKEKPNILPTSAVSSLNGKNTASVSLKLLLYSIIFTVLGCFILSLVLKI